MPGGMQAGLKQGTGCVCDLGGLPGGSMCRLLHSEVAQRCGPVASVQRHTLAGVLVKREEHGGGLAVLPWLLHC